MGNFMQKMSKTVSYDRLRGQNHKNFCRIFNQKSLNLLPDTGPERYSGPKLEKNGFLAEKL